MPEDQMDQVEDKALTQAERLEIANAVWVKGKTAGANAPMPYWPSSADGQEDFIQAMAKKLMKPAASSG